MSVETKNSGNNKRSKKLNEFAENEFRKVLSTIDENNIKSKSLKKLKSIQMIINLSENKKSEKEIKFSHILSIIIIVIVIYLSGVCTREGFSRMWFWWKKVNQKENIYCTIDMPTSVQNSFMPQFDCNLCQPLENIPKVSNLTPDEFSERYAYNGVPVVVIDAMLNWTASDVFSFDFFKQTYPEDSPALDSYESGCQFFPYKTQFRSLRQVFNMSDQRARLEPGSEPWYIGW